MREFINDAEPDIASPRRFLADAKRDLRRAIPAAIELFRVRLRAQSRGNWLGQFWLFIPTIVIVATSVFIQRRSIVAISATDIAYPAFVLTGLVAWQIFVDAINAPLRRLDEARQLLTRSDVPHETVLFAAAFDTGFTALVRMIVVVPVIALTWVTPDWGLLMLPIALAALLIAGLGIGLFLAPVAMLFGDVRHAMGMGLVLWMFLTPVFYPMPNLWWARFNPARPLVEGLRHAMTGGGVPMGFAITFIGCTLLLVMSWVFYRLARPVIVERLG